MSYGAHRWWNKILVPGNLLLGLTEAMHLTKRAQVVQNKINYFYFGLNQGNS